MGQLQDINAIDYIEKYNIDTFIETGTGTGATIDYILTNGRIRHIYSIELVKEIYDNALQKYMNNSNITLYNTSSYNGLNTLTQSISNRTIFWLDAHYPGFGYTNNNLLQYDNLDIRFPLEKELDVLISKKKNIELDVIIIDDLRIYKKGAYTRGNIDNKYMSNFDIMAYIYSKFQTSHNIQELYQDEGYIIITPKAI